jgi:glycerophosphoryl diester phosphodiesterase
VAVVMTWPVNDDATLERVGGLGVNAVISDEPRILRSVLSKRG